VVEEWTSSEAHGAALTNPAVRALIAEAGPLIAGMGVATVLDVRGGIGAA
jgi:quinol monooxygenase YgiN